MRKSNPTVAKNNLYEVIGADGSILLSRTGSYLKHGEQIELTPTEAETLLGAGLVKEVIASHQETHEENKEQ